MLLFFSWSILLSHLFTLNMDRKYPVRHLTSQQTRPYYLKHFVKSASYRYYCILARTLPLKQANEASLNWINNDEWRIADPGWLRPSAIFFTANGQSVKKTART
jgi:hypothetical protein